MLLWAITAGVLLDTLLIPHDASSTWLGPVVSTKAGSFQGIQVSLPGLQKSIYAFLGIPYAKPPIGPLRFSRSIPADFISGLFSATTKPPSCFQLESDLRRNFAWADKSSWMSEDCLYLNIWTPETFVSPENLKAVMVWIHGGGFSAGSSAMDLYDGQVLSALGQVVVVTFNYRLGPFGFMDTLIDDTTGNAGLYDQLLVLKWVQTNIEYFGGDPKRVTLFGEIGGAMSAGLLALSPLSRGLFHRLITLSGSVYSIGGTTPTRSAGNGNLLATLVGCATDTFTLFTNAKEIVSCLRNVPAAELTKTYFKQQGSQLEEITIYFRPKFWDEVIPKNPIDIFLSRNYSSYELLTGITENEGAGFEYFSPDIYQEYAKGNLIITKALAATMLSTLYEEIGLTEEQEAVDYYLKDIGDDEESVLRAVLNGVGDAILICPTVFFAERYSEKGTPVFFYRYDHRSSTSPWPESMGAAHFEEVPFVFGLPFRYPERYNIEEIALSEYMIRTWTNFAKSENLTLQNGSQWPNYCPSKPEYATFQTGRQTTGSGPRKAACEFWRPYFRAW